jgi:hypothetical protein
MLSRKSSQGNGLDYLVELPGQALEHCREALGVKIPEMIAYFQAEGWHVTRLDLAVDTTNEKINPQYVYDRLCSPNVVCKAKDKNPVMGKSKIGLPGNVNGEGMTVYIGRRSSARMMRVYDKSAEVAEKTGGEIGHKTRFELECKQEIADVLAAEIARDGESVIPSILHGFIDFKTETGRAQMTKRDTAKWWLEIVGAGKTCPGLTTGISTPEKAAKWQLNQWANVFTLTKKHNPAMFEQLEARANINPELERLWSQKYGTVAAAAASDTGKAQGIEGRTSGEVEKTVAVAGYAGVKKPAECPPVGERIGRHTGNGWQLGAGRLPAQDRKRVQGIQS